MGASRAGCLFSTWQCSAWWACVCVLQAICTATSCVLCLSQHVCQTYMVALYAARRTLEHAGNISLHKLNSEESQVAQESMLIAQAGMSQHITVATNMAGRGTDIVLGGDPAQLLQLALAAPYNGPALKRYKDARSKSKEQDKGKSTPESRAVAEIQVRIIATAWLCMRGSEMASVSCGQCDAISL